MPKDTGQLNWMEGEAVFFRTTYLVQDLGIRTAIAGKLQTNEKSKLFFRNKEPMKL